MPKRQDQPTPTIEQIAQQDGRYSPHAYYFVFEALRFTQKLFGKNPAGRQEAERHVSGQQLVEGIRQMALEQFGYMARVVLAEWGIRETSDFGEIVFRLVNSGLMGKTENDSLDDFKARYDFGEAFDKGFKFSIHSPSIRMRPSRDTGEQTV